MTGWDKFLHLLHIFGRLGWDATAKFTKPVTDIRKSNAEGGQRLCSQNQLIVRNMDYDTFSK